MSEGVALAHVQAGDLPTTRLPSPYGARFDAALGRARRCDQVAQAARRAPPTSPPLSTRRPSITFGPSAPEAGIQVHRHRSDGLTPFQIYRRSPFGYRTNTELQAQLAATPGLDPELFGHRPGAPIKADRRLHSGDPVIVLDQTRLGFLEQQRQLLGQGRPSAELTDSIVGEIDYATMGQAVPSFDHVSANIRARAPSDQAYRQAIGQAKTRLEAKWRAEGRAADQIGQLREAGKAHDFGRVRQLAGRQFTELADRLGPGAVSEAISGAITARVAVYTTYVTGDPRYAEAVRQRAADATREVLIERPIDQVLGVAEAGSADWHHRAIAKLRAVTDPATHTPQQVQAIMGDPRIKHLVRQSLRHAPTLHTPEQRPVYASLTERDTVLTDLSAIYSAPLYADGRLPGTGKALVDEMAGFIVDHTQLDDYTIGGVPPIGRELQQQAVARAFSHAFYKAAGEGHLALPLAVSARAQGANNPAFLGINDPSYAAADGIRRYQQHLDGLRDAHLRRKPMQLGLDAYAPALRGTHGFDRAASRLGEIPPLQQLPDAPGISPTEPTGSLWLQRSLRLAAHEIVKNWFSLPDGGKFDRASRGFSAYLFAANTQVLINSEFIDQLYVPMHGAMAFGELTRAVLPDAWRAAVFDTDAAGRPNALLTFSRTNGALQARISALHVDDWTKTILRRSSAGMLPDGLYVAYTAADFGNTIAYFTGQTQKGEVDLARGFGFAISAVDDAMCLTGSGALGAGPFLGHSLLWWTGWAIAFQIASGINYYKGRYDKAHAFDAETARAWQLLGTRDPRIAATLGRGDALADRYLNSNADPLLVESFHQAGNSTRQMIDFINRRWSPDQAFKIAKQIREVGSISSPRDPIPRSQIARVAKYARDAKIPFPDIRLPLPSR